MYAEFITSKGIMVAKLYYDKVPTTVANFVSLAEGSNTLVDEAYKDKKFYNGLIFHRVMDNFMIQGGDPLGTGFGNPGYRFNDEFIPELKHDTLGILSMANSGPNTNGSQFFIIERPTPHLNNVHTVFGKLVLGQNVLEAISSVKTDAKNKPLTDVVIEELNIIKKGAKAKSFDAPTVFKNHFIEAERLEKEKAEKAAAILKANQEKFNAQRENAIMLPSGLEYTITEKGSGEKIKETDRVLTDYAVFFEDGTLIATSKLETAETHDKVNERQKAANAYVPYEAEVGPDAQMIPGFKEGLKQLNVGDKATLFIPYHLGYGESQHQGIPPRTNLVFEVEIIEIIK
ncbi:peptidylprolyl isomerase [Flavobacteriaceae bacterium XHP0103]|nr:peptidylprolyl isomerase [Marixanthotalea marina]